MIPANTINLYFRANRDLIPISKNDPHKGKRPLHKEWTSRQYSRAEIRKYARNGFNLGWRLGPNDLVIDIDPRNGGQDSIESLCAELELDFETLTQEYPTVKTGGGGFHVYTTIPDGLRTIETDKTIPGIEFKRRNRQVIIPGSVHPTTGDPYQWIDDSVIEDSRAPDIPPKLLKWLLERTKKNVTGNAAGADQIDTEDLARLLEVVPVEDYAENDQWFKILAAAHSATGGAGLAEFLAWSLSDPVYADHEQIIRSRWNSLGNEKDTLITAQTLYQAVAKYDPPVLVPIVQKQTRNAFDTGEEVEIKESKETKKSHVSDLVATLTKDSKSKKIESILRKVLLLRSIDRNKLLDDIRKNTGLTKVALNESIKELRKDRRVNDKSEGNIEALEDIAEKAITLLLKTKYANGDHILHAADQRFWTFNKTHWEIRPQNLIHQDILGACEKLKISKPDLEFNTSSTLRQAETILRARVATSRDMFRLKERPPSIVNTLNCEVWIDSLTGEQTAKDHDPKSYLTSVLETEYDPEAKAPLFLETVAGIAQQEADPDEWARHLFELIGYSLQPLKDVATWVLFQGYGSNGKSFILNIISKILGAAALEKSIKELSSDYAHAYADLPGKLVVIDEDIRAGTLLPDDTLKKISENKVLTANPKHVAQFQFKSSAIIIMASNSWPQTRDLSQGMRRRAMVLPFRHQFNVSDMDTRRADKVIAKELAGVLNIFLAGLVRFRKRGFFKVPDSCVVAADQWVKEAHPFNAFIHQNFTITKKATCKLTVAWNQYNFWCLENHIQNPLSKISFTRSIKQTGHHIRRGGKGYMVIEGLKQNFETEEGSLW